ncbi:MAG: 1-deoxy-D-xylulose-5-phosphate reductoisomerase [Coriobacteriales bacterium]|jgi:1-deoxy-D-xylulose-5-phosphate reductoisomerase|nr:1-deoxy-D-xylulose-5-phosphate reductoisomerase [Coriobacteriales bacterium]
MTEVKRIAILGSTGSIGTQTLDVVSRHSKKLKVVALAANSNADMLKKQSALFNVLESRCLLASELTAKHGANCAAAAIAALASFEDVDIVVNAMVGAAGLRASYEAIMAGKCLALANKESMVVGGNLLMNLAKSTGAQILPVDSEHSAIFQCLLGENAQEVSAIWLTASGGPFRGYSRSQLQNVTKEDTLRHPTWKMGPKITVDSATLMNKGLEVIEAHHLFQIDYDAIKVVVHPQSCIHSLVAYKDGSVKAHLGVTDMRIPIQFALSYPKRWSSAIKQHELDFTQLHDLTFAAADTNTFGCLRLALEAGRAGGTMPTVLNAANEVAVEAFLDGKLSFLDVEKTIEFAMSHFTAKPVNSLDQLLELDAEVRNFTLKHLDEQ